MSALDLSLNTERLTVHCGGPECDCLGTPRCRALEPAFATSARAAAYVDGKPARVLPYDASLGCVVENPTAVQDLITAYKRLGGLLAEAETALATAQTKLSAEPSDDEVEAVCEAGWEELRSLMKADPAYAFEIGPWTAQPPANLAKGRAETRAALAAFLAKRRG
ncbi:hypothetical protein ACLBYG_21980 [Methylobacterium sp. D53M]